MIKEQLDDIGPIAVTAKIAELMETGPGEITMAAFNYWREEFDLWNATQSGDALIRDPLLSQKYTAGVRKLGKEISNDLKSEVRNLNARGTRSNAREKAAADRDGPQFQGLSGVRRAAPHSIASPGSQCWLTPNENVRHAHTGSVDDLEDISNLDQYITRAKAVLIFCTD
eukprot:3814083-Prymnesium_polylepis.1